MEGSNGGGRGREGKPGAPAAPIVAAALWWVTLFLVLAAVTIESLSSSPIRLQLVVVVAAGSLLAASVYFNSNKKCSPGTFTGLRRFNTVMVLLAGLAVVAFALLPREREGAPDVVTPPFSTVAPGVTDAELAAAEKRTYRVRGMVCQSCVETVTQALLGVPGVLAADVELEGGSALVSLDSGSVPPDSSLLNSVARAGYELWTTSGEAMEPGGSDR